MYKTSIPKESTTCVNYENNLIHTTDKKIKYQNLYTETLIDIIIDREDTINYLKQECKSNGEIIHNLQDKLRHIEQYFDDLDDIDYKTIKYEVEKILNER